jgi:predicted metal-binding membrane protein
MAHSTGRRVLVPVLLAMSGIAWAALALWHASPYAHFMHAEALAAPGLACEPVSAPLRAGFYVAGWLLMTIAMMLPTTLPLVAVFVRLTGARPERTSLLAWLLAGYVAVWAGFGVAAYAVHAAIHAWTEGSGWVWTHGWVIGATTLAIAGAFQFSRLKERCLDECRSPMAFAVSRWRGARPRREAFRLGIDHGAYCVGCCWALMLLMFTVGLGSIGWMIALGVVMAVEKNLPWGRRLSRPLGIALLAGGAAIAVSQLAPALS